MAHIVTLNTPLREDWLAQLADVVTNPDELLHLLQIEADENLRAGQDARRLFALRVPRAFTCLPSACRALYCAHGEGQP
ncbi:Lysine 2,3-aminomutase family protein [Salmonella enterica subsp. enterica serovar Montevideo str. S5-403]|uniref:Lysine 2,3-aminomutase family protein n=1 Tax=Salmonella enterica subsp. enterica serovar Montevideo str. S5-403 TaxID=913242 RepID=G5QBT8_SALMO|nr:Lysine 2,3-aminomutase family protein [Salmonella enterica subsp. enterica serovar Montevideo str. S5-403]